MIMKRYSRYFQGIAAVILLLIPSFVFAEYYGSGAEIGSFFLQSLLDNLSFTPPKTDMSIYFLSEIFGAVPGITQFTGSTIVGKMFGVFNTGVLAMSGVFLAYTITKILTETTMDGAAMGKSATVWTAVRCALSTSLLVPGSSGYSVINGIIMWVVVQSIGLADTTWSIALQHLNNGGSLYATAQRTSFVDYSLINNGILACDNPGTCSSDAGAMDDVNTLTAVGTADILRSLSCSYVVYSALKSREISPTKPLPLNVADGFSLYKERPATCIPDATGGCSGYNDGYVVFPYLANEISSQKAEYYKDYLEKHADIPTNLTGICGTISYTVPRANSDTDASYTAKVNNYMMTKHAALLQIIQYLTPVARALVEGISKDKYTQARKLDPDTYKLTSDKTFFVDPNASAKYDRDNQWVWQPGFVQSLNSSFTFPLGSLELMAAAGMYQNALSPALTSSVDLLSADVSKKIEEANAHGWIAAGNYYRLLVNTAKTAMSNFDNYRLQTADAKPARDVTYDILFGRAMKNEEGGTTTAIDKIWGERGDKELLKKVLQWIRLVYPYAKVSGQAAVSLTMQEQQAGLVSGTQMNNWGNSVTNSISDKIKFVSLPSWCSGVTEAALWTKIGIGLVFLGTLPPLALPFLMTVPMDFLSLDVNQIFNKWNANMGAAGVSKDPILKLRDIGQSMITNSLKFTTQMQIYLGLMIAVVGGVSLAMQILGVALSVGSFWGATTGGVIVVGTIVEVIQSFYEQVQGLIFMQLPIALAALGPIFTCGVLLAIYVPLIPYLLFLFGAMSWFISVIVLMAASPIICFLMLWGNSSQENPLLGREAEQFIMQIIGVFFRPILMVMGLVIGMVLSYVSVELLNLGFSNVVSYVMTDTSGAMQLIQQIGLVVIYTFTMLSVVNFSFSTINLLYSEAMRIAQIQAPATGLEEKQMEGVKGGVQQFGEAGAGGVRDSASSLKGSAKTVNSSNLDEMKADIKKAGVERRAKKKLQSSAS